MTDKYGNELLHRVLLSAMKDIDKICRENGLKYYLHAGSLLGALNHKGFIPWDDDVDISMMRADYERFVEIVQRDYADKYFMQTYETDEQHRHNRAVLRVLGTKMIYYHDTNTKHQEIGVDIVPLYAVPKSRLMQRIQEYLIWIYDIAVQIKYGDIIPQSIFTKLISLLSRKDRVKLGRKIDKIMVNGGNDNSEYVGVLCYTSVSPFNGKSGYKDNNILRKYYENPIDIEFEDAVFMTTSEPEREMDRRYGAHWAEPYPEEKRITKHDVKGYEISPEVMERIGK